MGLWPDPAGFLLCSYEVGVNYWAGEYSFARPVSAHRLLEPHLRSCIFAAILDPSGFPLNQGHRRAQSKQMIPSYYSFPEHPIRFAKGLRPFLRTSRGCCDGHAFCKFDPPPSSSCSVCFTLCTARGDGTAWLWCPGSLQDQASILHLCSAAKGAVCKMGPEGGPS